MSDRDEDAQARGAPGAGGNERLVLRVVEAILFASAEPVGEAELAERLPPGTDAGAVLARLQADYAGRGIELTRVAGKWMFRTADDLAYLMQRHASEQKRLSRAALETLAIVAYHQPVTRAEIEQVRGVAIHRGTLDTLLSTGWVRMRGRRRSPGRPVTYGTTEAFLAHFQLETIGDLPGLEELRGLGLLEGQPPAGFMVPMPSDDPALGGDEDPLEPDADLAAMEPEGGGDEV